MKETIVVVHCASTGMNFIDDIRSRGYEPVLLKIEDYAGTEEDKALLAGQDLTESRRFGKIRIIPYDPDYWVLLRRVQEVNPKLVLAGSEFGVELATRLAADLGLPGNPPELLPAMTRKDAMHEALKRYGIRYIRGEVVTTVEEAVAFYETLGTEKAVVKRTRGCGTQGVYLCDTREEFMEAIQKELGDRATLDGEKIEVMVQERIMGEEFIVNTVSCNGRHHLASIWKYRKIRMPNGTNAYISAENVTRMEIGYTEMVSYAFDVVNAIGIQWGPVHGEYMIDEKGPVLIEVNCRPMGGAMDRRFLEKLYSHHETDLILDAFLNPDGFRKTQRKIYKPLRKGFLKIFLLTEDVRTDSAPIVSLCKGLRSYHDSIFDRVGRDIVIEKTRNLETSGGYVFLVHDSEQVVEQDANLLHTLEMHFPKLLFQNIAEASQPDMVPRDIETVMAEKVCRGSTLIVSDRADTPELFPEELYATVVSPDDVKDAYDSYEQVILDLTRPESFRDLEILFHQIFVSLTRLRPKGRVLIPESTYSLMPYGVSGMEALLMVAGAEIEVPDCGEERTLVGIL